MATQLNLGQSEHLTFKGNLKQTRYGWLRLTPAYSVHLVSELLDAYVSDGAVILDPYCGTGTTALVCAERGIACDTSDINPFLLWLTQVKTRSYTPSELDSLMTASEEIVSAITLGAESPPWIPPIHQIEKWWDEATLRCLGYAMAAVKALDDSVPSGTADLLRVIFCRTMIECANVSFGHQSMSFKKNTRGTLQLYPEQDMVAASWKHAYAMIASSATTPIMLPPRTILCDARSLTTSLDANRYSCVITSPPYPNRMSYIRELRPYMYWLGYLRDGREAGDLDWQAIGGTWGVATSNLTRWTPKNGTVVPFEGFDMILDSIANKSTLLSRYVEKYFHDMVVHSQELITLTKPGGTVHYIVGNSKFYDVLLPVESIFAALFEATGFERTQVRVIRKRTSKKELFEYVVSAQKPVDSA